MATRTKKKPIGTIRPSAVPVDVYNEGLCVYVWDEASGPELRRLVDDPAYRTCSPRKTFFENLRVRKFAAEVARRGLAMAYTLDQDDEVSVEVCVGPPLTTEELAEACWHTPQHAFMSLPSGRLRIDTPNTMPLDPDEKDDPGSVVNVPPGEYLLTLYRVDWAALKRSGKRYKGPQEFLLLTPHNEAPGHKSSGPILEYNARAPRTPKAVKASSQNLKQFKCKLAFISYWERFGVNLTRASAENLGLTPGTRLRLHADKFKIEALYLGDLTVPDFLRYAGKDFVDTLAGCHAEFALSDWTRLLGSKDERLGFSRYKASKCVPERLMEVWASATGEVLEERVILPQPAASVPAEVRNNAIHATVLFSHPEEVVLNVTREQLDAIGATPGNLLILKPSGAPPHTMIYGAAKDAQSRNSVIDSKVNPKHEEFYFKMLTGAFSIRFFTIGGAGRNPIYNGDLPVTQLDDKQSWPVVGVLLPPVGSRTEDTLRLTPCAHNADKTHEPWTTGLRPGTTVVLSKT